MSPAVFRFATAQWRPAQRELTVDGHTVRLGARALDLLEALVERRDRMVTKAELLDVVWPGLIVEEANLHVQVSALRKVLGKGAIATIPGRGYRFVAPIVGESPHAETPAPSPPGRGNLPASTLRMIGRDDALADVVDRCRRESLLTLTGPGGVGKSRLALAAATELSADFEDGAWWIDLAATDRDGDVVNAVAQSLQLTLSGPREAPQLGEALRGKSLLLVLDNCEHVAVGAAAVVVAVRAADPGIHVLATSQCPLGPENEVVVRVEPLAVPADDSDAGEHYAALALFVARARAVADTFALDAVNAPMVAQICRELDGLPLAIELAAARVRLLGVRGLRDRLKDRLRVLSAGSRSAIPRQQTLRAALEWSHSLLAPAEQAVLRRLGVFVGGFTLELAQSVAADADGGAIDEWAVLDHLGTLIDKSLVAADTGEPVRYRLLESVRAFALEQLATTGELLDVRLRHAEALAAELARIEDARWSDEGTLSGDEAMRMLVPEVPNVRAALDFSIAQRKWPLAVSLAGSSASVLFFVGLLHEAVATMRALLPYVDSVSPVAQTVLLTRLGSMGSFADLPRDELHLIKERAAKTARTAGQRRRLLLALATLAAGLISREDLEAASAVVEEMERETRHDDPASTACLAPSVRAQIHIRRHELVQAAAALVHQRTLLLGVDGDAGGLAATEMNLSQVLSALGRDEESIAVIDEAMARPRFPRSLVAPLSLQRVLSLAALGRTEAAMAVARENAAAWERPGLVFRYGCEALAVLALRRGRLDDAYRIEGAQEGYIARVRGQMHGLTLRVRQMLREAADAAGAGTATIAGWRAEGQRLPERSLIDLALR